VIPVGEGLEPLDEYYLWCDHRAFAEAEEITSKAHALGFEGIEWCGGVYSHEWGFAKLLHWLRHNPEKRHKFVTALEHCDMVAATLSGITQVSELKRSVCAMGHKWMWNPKWGGLPPEEFLVAVDPLFAGYGGRSAGSFSPAIIWPGIFHPSGLRRWVCARGFRFRWGRSTRIGTRSGRIARGRRGECGGHVDLHYCHGEEG